MTFLYDVGDPLQSPTNFPDYVHRVSFRRYCSLKLSLSGKSSKIGGFESVVCKGTGYGRCRTYVLKSHSLPSMWPVLIDFRSVNSEGS